MRQISLAEDEAAACAGVVAVIAAPDAKALPATAAAPA
jgi:hypothetical protein